MVQIEKIERTLFIYSSSLFFFLSTKEVNWFKRIKPIIDVNVRDNISVRYCVLHALIHNSIWYLIHV